MGSLGFIMVETVLLQRLHSLSRPTHLYTRHCSGRTVNLHGNWFLCFESFRASSKWSFVPVIAAILSALGLMALLTPFVLSAAVELGLLWRVLISLLLIVPFGFALGMPFPKGLRTLGLAAPELVFWAWGVNGFFTVIGSIAAVILGMALGFLFVLGVAAVC